MSTNDLRATVAGGQPANDLLFALANEDEARLGGGVSQLPPRGGTAHHHKSRSRGLANIDPKFTSQVQTIQIIEYIEYIEYIENLLYYISRRPRPWGIFAR
jgi:hypothetical protein